MNTFCRLCLGEKSKLLDVFEEFGILRLTAADAIAELLQIQVIASDTYPQRVCIECLKILGDFKLFKHRCESNKDLLDRTYARNLQIEPNKELVEGSRSCDVSNKEECIENPSNEHENVVPTEFEEYVYDSYETSSDKLIESDNTVNTPIKYEDNVMRVQTDEIDEPHCSTVTKSNKKIHQLGDSPCKNYFDDPNNVHFEEEVIDLNQDESENDEECRPMIKDDPLRVTRTNSGGLQRKKQCYYLICKKLNSSSSVPKGDNNGQTGPIGVVRSSRVGKIVGNAEQVNESKSVSSNAEVNTCICEICGEAFVQLHDLEAHMSSHNIDKQFICGSCNRVFYLNDSLRQHKCIVDDKHDSKSVQKQLKCDWCSKNVSGFSVIKENESIQCNECYEAISRVDDVVSHHPDDFVCPMCNKTYSRKRNLQAHMLKHSKKRDFECSECSKAFYQKSDLNRHVMRHSRKRPFKCSVCWMAFYQSSHLESHAKTHSEEQLFRCAECDKTYLRKSDVKRHMKIHSGNKPFKCIKCSRTFFYKNNLKVHFLTHSGD